MDRVKFLHMADTHLGYRQYKNTHRFRDFNAAFMKILYKAIEEEVDFILLAGDIFEQGNATPETITAIYTAINKFKAKSKEKLGRYIPIIAIEGNHDQIGFSSKRSWAEFLANLDLITLLDPEYDNTEKKIHFNKSKKGNKGMVTINETCIYGIPYYGSNTDDFLPILHDSINTRPDGINILMMHYGIQGQEEDERGIELSNKSLIDLREKVDYLALGHYHKQYSLPAEDPWIFNPGSTEINSAKEIFREYERGIYIVEFLDKNVKNIKKINFSNGKADSPDSISNRSFRRIDINLDRAELVNFELTLEYIINSAQMRTLLPNNDGDFNARDPEIPVVFLSLSGDLQYSMLEFNIKKIIECIRDEFKILDVRVFSFVKSMIDGVEIDSNPEKTLQQIEQEVFQSLVDVNQQYRPLKGKIVELLKEIKSKLLSNDTEPEKLKEKILAWWAKNIDKDTKVFENQISKLMKAKEITDSNMEDDTPEEEFIAQSQENGDLIEFLGDEYDDGRD